MVPGVQGPTQNTYNPYADILSLADAFVQYGNNNTVVAKIVDLFKTRGMVITTAEAVDIAVTARAEITKMTDKSTKPHLQSLLEECREYGPDMENFAEKNQAYNELVQKSTQHHAVCLANRIWDRISPNQTAIKLCDLISTPLN